MKIRKILIDTTGKGGGMPTFEFWVDASWKPDNIKKFITETFSSIKKNNYSYYVSNQELLNKDRVVMTKEEIFNLIYDSCVEQ